MHFNAFYCILMHTCWKMKCSWHFGLKIGSIMATYFSHFLSHFQSLTFNWNNAIWDSIFSASDASMQIQHCVSKSNYVVFLIKKIFHSQSFINQFVYGIWTIWLILIHETATKNIVFCSIVLNLSQLWLNSPFSQES